MSGATAIAVRNCFEVPVAATFSQCLAIVGDDDEVGAGERVQDALLEVT